VFPQGDPVYRGVTYSHPSFQGRANNLLLTYMFSNGIIKK